MKTDRTGYYVVGMSSLCLHFDVMPSMVWSLNFVRIVSMMMCYYLVAYPGAVTMDMMTFDDLTIPDLSTIAIVMYLIFCEKYPLWFPYCRDLFQYRSVVSNSIDVKINSVQFNIHCNRYILTRDLVSSKPNVFKMYTKTHTSFFF